MYMDLQEFVKKAISDIVKGAQDASNELGRSISFTKQGERRTIEFDLTVTVEETSGKGVGGKIGVASVLSAGAESVKEARHMNMNRIQFGIDIDNRTKAEINAQRVQLEERHRQMRSEDY